MSKNADKSKSFINRQQLREKRPSDPNLRTAASLLICCTVISFVWTLMAFFSIGIVRMFDLTNILISLLLFGSSIYLRQTLPPKYLAKHPFLHKSSLVGSILCLIPGAITAFVLILLVVAIVLGGGLPVPT